MKQIAVIVLLVLFIVEPGVAQKEVTRFSSFNSLGAAVGKTFPGLVVETVNGVKFSKWFSGIGVGVDKYEYKTLPLFIDGRWFLGDDENGFIYSDIGYDFPMKNKPGKGIYYDSYEFTGGIYTDIGIGYQVPFYKKSSLLFSLGYSYKKTGTKIGVNICPFAGPCYVDYSKYDYSFGRIILKAGLAL